MTSSNQFPRSRVFIEGQFSSYASCLLHSFHSCGLTPLLAFSFSLFVLLFFHLVWNGLVKLVACSHLAVPAA